MLALFVGSLALFAAMETVDAQDKLIDPGPGVGCSLNDSTRAVLSADLYSDGTVTPQRPEDLAINASDQVGATNSAGTRFYTATAP